MDFLVKLRVGVVRKLVIFEEVLGGSERVASLVSNQWCLSSFSEKSY